MNTPAAAPLKAKAPAKEGAEKYATMIVGIGKSREALHTQLSAAADKLGVKVGHLVWFAVEAMLKNVPTSVAQLGIPVSTGRVGGVASVGSAPGFWIVPVLDAAGKAASVRVQEVAKRPDAQGREFYRYTVDAAKPEDTKKNRDRAMKQAVRGAKSDMAFLGLKDAAVKVDEIKAA